MYSNLEIFLKMLFKLWKKISKKSEFVTKIFQKNSEHWEVSHPKKKANSKFKPATIKVGNVS
jgi:hypothetical protein